MKVGGTYICMIHSSTEETFMMFFILDTVGDITVTK